MQVMNLYMVLLQNRDIEKAAKIKFSERKLFFGTYFLSKLFQDTETFNYSNVTKWTNNVKIPILAMKEIFFPCNMHGNHWSLFVLNVQDSTVYLLDSLGGGEGFRHLAESILKWMEEEVRQKSPDKHFSTHKWKIDLSLTYRGQRIPQQSNSIDCGVFVLMYACFLGDGLPLSFTQDNMILFRHKILDDIIRNKLVYKY